MRPGPTQGKLYELGVGGAVEVAFDDENGHIIVEIIAAKICRGVIDIGREVLGRQ
jgi:hypothetical protein